MQKLHTNMSKNTFWNIVWKYRNWVFLITDVKLLKLFSAVCEFGSKTCVWKNYKNHPPKLYRLITKSISKRQRTLYSNALSFHVTKTVLVSPKWFGSDKIDLDLTIMIWSRPKWNGHNQNEFVRPKLWFSTKMKNIWTWPIHFSCDHFI